MDSSNSDGKSNFKQALFRVPVPIRLQNDGIEVLRVYANGKTQTSFLTLSEDKFTLYLTKERNGWQNRSKKGWFGRNKATSGQENRAIDIGAIHRIQRGHNTKRFEMARKNRQDSMKSLLSTNSNMASSLMSTDDSTILNPSQSFSIIFRGDWTVDLMMLSSGPNTITSTTTTTTPNTPPTTPTANSFRRDEILDALDQLLNTYQGQKKKVSNEVLLLRFAWLDAVSDKDNKSQNIINASEFSRLLDRMNYQIKKSRLNETYEKFGKMIGLDRKMRKQGLSFEQACTLLHKLKRDSTWIAKPINAYWNDIFGEFMKNGKPRPNVSDKTFLEKFLWKTQGEKHQTIQDVRKLFAKLNALELPHLLAGDSQEKDPTRIDKNRFEAYLLGLDNDAFCPNREQFNARSMNRPISEYWVNSSHNTYLTGDQFTSISRVDMYSNALYRGCRCLELDIWDGDMGDDGLPRAVVWHGHTMTSKILFKDIIKSLKLFLNFHPDTFPLILSFENHCSIPYQEVMAEQLVQILGKTLYIPTENSLNGRLPSPWELRGMVVIKCRRPSNLDFDNYDTEDDVSDDGVPSTVYGEDTQPATPPVQQKKVHYGVCPQLARLTLFHGCKLKNWDDSVMNATHHMHSFSENKVRSLARKTDRRKWAIYNQSHMSRTYPAGSRVDSSNYLPLLPWAVGCQLVALNFQTNDPALRLNDGRFRENGGCGYVLKPDSVMEMHLPTKEPRTPMKLSIRILSGSCLPNPKDQRAEKNIDPYVKVSVYDVQNGTKEVASTFQTAYVSNNGFFPIWNEEKFSFTVENASVAMLQLSIYDKQVAPSSDEFIASASIPISCLRKGLRSVKLFDMTNARSGAFDFASLLMDVRKSNAGGGIAAEEQQSFEMQSFEKPIPMSRRSVSVPEARQRQQQQQQQQQAYQRPDRHSATTAHHRRTDSGKQQRSHRRSGSDSLAEF